MLTFYKAYLEKETTLASQGIEIDRRKILLEQPIKELGEHAIDIKLNAGVNAIVKINVISEDAQPVSADVPAETPADA